jgi:site-specific recombinase XerD
MKKIVTTQLPHLDDFLLDLQTNNYSPKTVYNYERDLQVFEDFLNECKITFNTLDKRTILNYKAYLVSRDRKTAKKHTSKQRLASFSVNRMLSALRSYLRFLTDIDYNIPVAPNVIKLLKREKKHPRVAELNELIRFIEAPSQFESNKHVAARNRAMLEMLFSTGMRISELINLNRQQIDHSGRIFIRGKGKKERFVYLTPRAYQYVKTYLVMRSDAHPALFVPYRGRNAKKTAGEKRRISTNYLQERIKFYREKLGINVPTSAHSLRHGFATYLAEQGANPAALQILLGHESLDTTTRYVHASDRYAESQHQKFHPLKKSDQK